MEVETRAISSFSFEEDTPVAPGEQDIPVLEKSSSSCSSSLSFMSEQVDHLDRLFTNQELEMAKMDIHNLKMEVKKKNDKIREIQSKNTQG
jgi:hypothetical protein